MPGSLTDIYAVLNTIAQTITNLTTNQNSIFPHVTAASSTATAGAITPPAQVGGYLIVTTSSGGTVKVPWYPQ